MIDTSVRIECREDEELKTAVRDLISRHGLRSSEIIEDEVKDAYYLNLENPSATASKGLPANFLLRIKYMSYTSACSTVELGFQNQRFAQQCILNFKGGYVMLVQNLFLNLIPDGFILTLTRKTMASEILPGKETIRRFSYA